MRTPALAQPLEIGRLVLRNRIVGAPMERNLCEIDGRVTDSYVSYLEARARGGAALVHTEASYVRVDGKGRLRQMGVHTDAVIPGLRRLATAVHREGSLLGVELNHGGRTSQARVSGLQPVAPSPIPCAIAGGDLPLELTEEDIVDIVACFGAGAARCREAGVDVVTVHAAHGYLIHQFLSPRTNLRRDRWSEPTLFLNEVLQAVRRAAEGLVVGIRVSAFEGTPGGLDAEKTLEFLEGARLDLVDFVDVSAGSYEGREWIVQPGEWPQGVLRPYALHYRRFGKPIGVAGRINSAAAAEEVVASGTADFVSLARALHADPEWPRKVLEGKAPRPCIACNFCIDQLGTGEPVPCSVNPEVGRETNRGQRQKLSRPRAHARVVVVGGGPAGLESAWRLAAAGFNVTLFERERHVGGQLALAASLHEYPEYKRILDWYESVLDELEVRIETETEADAPSVAAARPHAVILATGATGFLPEVEGIGHQRVTDVRDWIRRGRALEAGATHVVWGTDREGVAVADDIASRGGRVLLVGGTHELAPDVGARAKILVVPRLRSNPAVDIRLEASLVGIDDRSVLVARRDGEPERVVAVGPVLVSQGVVADTSLLRDLRSTGVSGILRAVGDAAGRGGRVAECIADATATADDVTTQLSAGC